MSIQIEYKSNDQSQGEILKFKEAHWKNEKTEIMLIASEITPSANINNLFNRKDYEVSLYQRANFQYYRVPLRGREFMISLRLKY